ncbi:MAG: isoprenyl transferase [Actinobacteria bacterium]|nr:isoprenyl transferase [Actinomycetota bacterium]MCL6088396.1 isoprenyl transferase [Actinomycetota bacterium]
MKIFSNLLPSNKISIIEELKKQPVPLHVAVIMDGNGRWASERGFPRIVGHKEGVKPLKRIVCLCSDLGIKYLTAYSFSSENWKRPQKEVSGLMQLFFETIASELEELNKNGVRIVLIGNRKMIPRKVLKRFEDAENATKNNNNVILNIAFSYGSRQEILEAARKACTNIKNNEADINDLDEKYFSGLLFTQNCPDPDLLIRTGGELRVSNFLLWQIAYSELYFTKTLWPDFTDAEFLQAIHDYQCRNRRFGKI